MKTFNKQKVRSVPRGTFLIKILFLFLIFNLFNVKSFSAVTYPLLYGDSNLLIDANSGIIYLKDNIDEQLPIASLTKLMSIYIVFEEMEKQKVNLNDEVVISEKVAGLHVENPEVSGVYFVKGESVSVQKLIELSLIFSDNGAIIALAEKFCGSESNMVKKMNEKAEDLSMDNSIFYNVTGLTMVDYGSYILPGTSKSDLNKSSARDMALLSYNLINDYPQILDYTSKNSVEFRGYEYYTYNLLLEDMTYEYKGVKGLKTGTTKEAGECFISYYEKDDSEYISVVLNVKPKENINRFLETIKMYEWIDEQTLVNIAKEDKVIDSIRIKGSISFSVDLYSKYDINILKTSNLYVNKTREELNKEYFDDKGYLKKTIPKGAVVKSVYFQIPKDTIALDSVLGNGKEIRVDLVTKEEIKEANFITKVFLSFEVFIEQLFN